MSKYIDADRLKAEIERRKGYISVTHFAEELLSFINSLQQEQQELPNKEIAEYYYHKGLYEGLSQGHSNALKILEEVAKSKADPVIVIKQQEQPSLPSNLDEASKKIVIQLHPCMEYSSVLGEHLTIGELVELVKAGANWQQRQPCEDLKGEIREWANLMVGASFPEQDGDYISEEDYRSVIRQTALHFYELGKKSK